MTNLPLLDKRKKMKRFKVSEISIIDKPAQEGAVITLQKRHDEELALFNKWMSEGATIVDENAECPTLVLKGQRRIFFLPAKKAAEVFNIKVNPPARSQEETTAAYMAICAAMSKEAEQLRDYIKETGEMSKPKDPDGERVEMIKRAENFEQRIAEIAKRDKCGGIDAMMKARRDHPDEFDAFQAYGDMEDIDDTEDMAKSMAAEVAFDKCVAEIRARDRCGPTEALRKARVEHPKEFELYQAWGVQQS